MDQRKKASAKISKKSQREDQRKSQPEEDFTFFRQIYKDNAFWSCVGYDGLSLAFHLPIEDIRSLPEDRKRALMALICRLGRRKNASLLDQIHALKGQTSHKRLIGLLNLGEQV